MRSSKSGSVLGATLIIALALSLVVAGLLHRGLTESRINQGDLLYVKAQYAAESTAEYAAAQIRCMLQQKPVYTASMFTASATPPTLANAALLGPDRAALLTSIAGSGSAGFATNITSTLSTLQSSASVPAARYRMSGLAVRVGTFTNERVQFLDPNSELYKTDTLRRQTMPVREVKIVAAATASDTKNNQTKTAYVEETLQIRDTAVFSFVGFYNMDLEVAPQPLMSVVGPLHSNRDLYVGSMNGLDFYDIVTAAGRVYGGQYPSGVTSMSNLNGDVTFNSTTGAQVSMKSGSTWYDSDYSDWYQTALSRWGGNLLSGVHGIMQTMPASIPAYVPDNPSTSANELVNDAHNLIEPSIQTTSSNYPGDDLEASKFANKACLVIVLNQTVSGSGSSSTATISPKIYRYTADTNGTYVRLTSSGIARFRREELKSTVFTATNLIIKGKFYDKRQGEYIHTADLDVGVLRNLINTSGVVGQLTNGSVKFTPDNDWNGVVYIEHNNPALNSTTMGAVRLINGRNLPNHPASGNQQVDGFTIATNAPLYILGNYNADGNLPSDPNDIVNTESGEVPAAIAADAVTVLSSKWTTGSSSSTYDSYSDDGSLSKLRAGQTEVAAAIMTGIVPSNKGRPGYTSGNGTWSGAINNIVRYLEDWSNVKVGFRSSVAVMYESEVANAPWLTSAYNPPIRIFGLNKSFVDGNYPPGSPSTRTYRRLGFRQLSKSEYDAALANINGS